MTNKIKTGTANWRTGCNASGKPDFEGQIIKFRSPYHSRVILTDIAVKDVYGYLKWIAYQPDEEK